MGAALGMRAGTKTKCFGEVGATRRFRRALTWKHPALESEPGIHEATLKEATYT